VVGLDNSGKTTIIHQLERLDRPGGFAVGHYPREFLAWFLLGSLLLLAWRLREKPNVPKLSWSRSVSPTSVAPSESPMSVGVAFGASLP
jgi:hypothetical protein